MEPSQLLRRRGGDGGNLGILSREPVIAANLGLSELIKTVVPGQMHSNPETNAPADGRSRGQLRNRMVVGEGPGTIEFRADLPAGGRRLYSEPTISSATSAPTGLPR